MLAAAWSLPQRCCHALRASVSSSVTAVSGGGAGESYQYRSYVGTAAQRASRTTAALAGGFVPGGAGRRKIAAAAAVAGRTGTGGSGSGSGTTTTTRMVSGGGSGSDESVFFTDPDAPAEVDGAGPPGPLVGGDQVRGATVLLLLCASCLGLRGSESLVLSSPQQQHQQQSANRALISTSRETAA